MVMKGGRENEELLLNDAVHGTKHGARSTTYILKTAIAPRSPFSIQGDVCLDKYRGKARKMGKENNKMRALVIN